MGSYEKWDLILNGGPSSFLYLMASQILIVMSELYLEIHTTSRFRSIPLCFLMARKFLRWNLVDLDQCL